MKLSRLISMKIPTIIDLFLLNSVESFISAVFSKKDFALVIQDLLAGQISCSAELSAEKVL